MGSDENKEDRHPVSTEKKTTKAQTVAMEEAAERIAVEKTRADGGALRTVNVGGGSSPFWIGNGKRQSRRAAEREER